MAVVQTKNENEQNVSLPRRIAAYIASMNFAKVFRRHHPRESSSPVPKSSERPPFIHHHRYTRPFSYHIPTTEQLSPSSLTKTSNVVPYRIGLSSDSTLLTNAQTNEDDEIVRLPIKNGKGHSPKIRKDRRFQSQLNANKRWLFRSMEALDGWKGKVFPQKNRPTNSSQSRSRSVENLADRDPNEHRLINPNPSTIKQQRAISPNRSIEAITNRVINSIGIHRKSANSIPNIPRSPALTIKKQSLFTHSTNGLDHIPKQYNNNNERNSSAILDFREISSLGFLQSRSRLTDENENSSLTPSENNNNGINSNDDEHEEETSNLSFLATGGGGGYDHNNNDDDNETADSWDFSITWVDSLKEQHSPQRKIQFYENLIKLLEQDTLNIDELLVLRKVLAKIWPTDETIPTTDYNNHTSSIDSKSLSTKSLHAPNKIKRRSKLSTMTHHTAQRCSAILEQSPLVYETLHEQNSGHGTKPSSLLLAAKAKPCFIENNNKDNSNLEQNYPQHLNPFADETDITPTKEFEHNNNESIRRYFERLTLLETIYEKLNIESNKTPVESIDHHQTISTQGNTTESIIKKYSSSEKQTHPQTHSLNTIDANKTISNKFCEMNVDGNISVNSGKSSLKRRAPTAPHISHPSMFTLSSTDLSVPHKTNQEINIPIRFKSHDDKFSKELSPKERLPLSTHNATASCDDDGQIFVYDPKPNPTHTNGEQSVKLPKRSERIQEWLSSCQIKEDNASLLPHTTSPKTQLKMRCIGKPMRHPSPSPQHYHEKNLSAIINNEIEPGRFRSSLKIHLETNEPINPRTRVSSATTRHHQRPPTILDEDLHISNTDYFHRHTLSPTFQRDHQAVYL